MGRLKMLLGGALLLGTASAGGAGMSMMAPMIAAAPASTALAATATLRDPQGAAQGTVTLRQMGLGVQVSVEARGLTPGQHGMHVHEFGRCTPGVDAATNTVVAFGGAGGHFDPARRHAGADEPLWRARADVVDVLVLARV